LLVDKASVSDPEPDSHWIRVLLAPDPDSEGVSQKTEILSHKGTKTMTVDPGKIDMAV
jgi:hypothetical protein